MSFSQKEKLNKVHSRLQGATHIFQCFREIVSQITDCRYVSWSLKTLYLLARLCMFSKGKNPVKLSWMLSGEFIVSMCCTRKKCINQSEMSNKHNKSWQDRLPDSVFMIFNSYGQEKRLVSLKSLPLKKMSAYRHNSSYKHQYPPWGNN